MPGERADVWRANALASVDVRARPSGHAALDAELPGGGWPRAGLIDLHLRAPGCGELRLLAPALAAPRDPAACVARPTLWIAPPLPLHAPALQLPLAQILRLDPAASADAAWAAEQALRAGVCHAVLWWGDAPLPMLRRLHLAALAGDTPLFALRPLAAAARPSPAPLRLALAPAGGGAIELSLFKRRGPPKAEPLRLALAGTPRLRPIATTATTAVGAKGPARAVGEAASASPAGPTGAPRHATQAPAPALSATGRQPDTIPEICADAVDRAAPARLAA